MEYVGKKVTKEVRGHAPRFGAVESYSPATGLFKVVYNGGDSEEMQLAELSPLLLAPLPQTMGGEIDLNVCREIDLNDDGRLHGLDLNEGMNYVLHEDLNSSLGKRKMIDLNLEADEEETVEGASSSKRVRLFDLNVESKDDPVEEVVDMGKKILEESRPAMAPPNFFHVDNNAGARIAAETELRRRILMASLASFAPQNYASFAAGVYSHLQNPPFQTSAAPAPVPVPVLPPKAELPSSSTSLDLKGASLLDFLSVYTFLRSFSVSLLLSPFEIEEFASSLISNGSTSLFDSIHLSLLTTLRGHLKSLSDEGSASVSVCLRSLNWDFLDTITWPMFLVEYLLFHSPKHIPGLDLDEFKPFESDYYAMPVSAKIAILQHLCDDVVETEAYRSEINKRASMAESHNWKSRYFSYKVKKTVVVAEDGAAKPCRVEEYNNEFVVDGNGDECYLCRADGSLICCDGCPAAFHAKCVGVVSSLLPEGDWFCPECTIHKAKPYTLSRNVRGVELRGSDPHGRLYYSCCDYLLVSDSCDEEHSFSLYNANDISAVVAALESSSALYHTIASAIREHWSLTPNHISSAGQNAFPESRALPLERKSDGSPLASNIPRNIAVPPHCNVASVPAETAHKGKASGNPLLVSSEGSTEVSQTKGSDNSQIQGVLAISGDVGASSSRDAGETAPPQESDYANSYEFGRMASPLSRELASKLSDEDARRSAEQIMAMQMRVISNRYTAFYAWSNMQNMNLQSKKEKCGWCFSCKFPEIAQTDCLFITNDTVRAANQKFASKALGIRAGAKMAKHLINVVCHVVWLEDRLLGLLSGPWTNPNYSKNWRAFAEEAAHIGYLKYLLLKLESNLHLRALSADWTKSVDSSVTMGSAFHVVRKSARVVSRIGGHSSRSKRKCSKKEINKTPEIAAGVSLSWWRGRRASRELFHWKVLPHLLASKAARRSGCEKIVGVYYPDSGEYAKRMKFIAWRAAVRAAKTVEQLALQVRVLDANIKWNEIGNINLLPEQESNKPAKSFKNVVIRKKRREGEVVKYLLDFGKSRLIPNIVVKHGSLLQNSSSSRKRYWLEESHVPLHLLKAFQEKHLLRASNNDTSEELHD